MKSAFPWTSDELREAWAAITAQQARALLRIVQAELDGRDIPDLLRGDGRICSPTTYYGRGHGRPGWKGDTAFQRALELARRDYRQWLLEHSTSESLAILAETGPEAARALRQQIVGDSTALAALEVALAAQDPDLRRRAAERLGATGLAAVVPALERALEREQVAEVSAALVDALGQVAGFRDSDRRAAALGVLDRADIRTAAKAAGSLNQDEYLSPLAHLSDAELEMVIANLEAAQVGDGGGIS